MSGSNKVLTKTELITRHKQLQTTVKEEKDNVALLKAQEIHLRGKLEEAESEIESYISEIKRLARSVQTHKLNTKQAKIHNDGVIEALKSKLTESKKNIESHVRSNEVLNRILEELSAVTIQYNKLPWYKQIFITEL